MALAPCSQCDGLLPPRAVACPHCDATIRPLRAALARVARIAVGSVAAVTLMACYGGPAYYDDCFDNDDDGWFPSCYASPCDPSVDPNCDCDDSNPVIHPGAVDRYGDGIDQDCSGADGPGKHRGDAAVDAAPDAAVDAAPDAPPL
jgi:hypothetical protein